MGKNFALDMLFAFDIQFFAAAVRSCSKVTISSFYGVLNSKNFQFMEGSKEQQLKNWNWERWVSIRLF